MSIFSTLTQNQIPGKPPSWLTVGLQSTFETDGSTSPQDGLIPLCLSSLQGFAGNIAQSLDISLKKYGTSVHLSIPSINIPLLPYGNSILRFHYRTPGVNPVATVPFQLPDELMPISTQIPIVDPQPLVPSNEGIHDLNFYVPTFVRWGGILPEPMPGTIQILGGDDPLTKGQIFFKNLGNWKPLHTIDLPEYSWLTTQIPIHTLSTNCFTWSSNS